MYPGNNCRTNPGYCPSESLPRTPFPPPHSHLAVNPVPRLGRPVWAVGYWFRSLRRNSYQRYFLCHRSGRRLGWYPWQQHTGCSHHCEADPNPGHHPYHFDSGGCTHPSRKESSRQCQSESNENLSLFVLFFVLSSIFTTVFHLPVSITGPLKELSKFLIIMAMAVIGLNTNIVKLVKTGAKPILLGFCCWLGISCVSLGMQHFGGSGKR